MKQIFSLVASAIMFASLLVVSSCAPGSTKSEASNQEGSISAQLQDLPTDDPLTLLKKGNQRFVLNKTVNVNEDSIRVKELIGGQNPLAVIVGCSDSRVSPELLFDQGLGDLFVIRTAGNVMSDYDLGSVEYAAGHLHTKLVVVLGHYGCGAVNAMLDHCCDTHAHPVPGHIAAIVKTLANQPEQKEVLANKDDQQSDRAVVANVVHGVKKLRESDPILKELYDAGKIQIVGAVYHIETGVVEYLPI